MNKVNDRSVYLITGLGNPGSKYQSNRHNVGFMVIDKLSENFDIQLGRVKSKTLHGSGLSGDVKVILAKPRTYMNRSGDSVSSLTHFYKIPLTNLLVIHDDLDLPFGKLRMKATGGAGGQKGLASIIAKLGRNKFPRLRVGIGRPPGNMDPTDFVLQDFSPNENEFLDVIIASAADAVQVFIQDGIQIAMNKFNRPQIDDS